MARVGPDAAVTVGELEDRIARMPAFQRASYGGSPDAIRRRVLEDVVVAQRLLEIAASRRGIERDPATAYALDRARSMATIRALRARVGDPSAVSDEQVRAYYDANRARYYEVGERVRVWRILCATREEAQSVIDVCRRGGLTPDAFAALARAHSRDKGTDLRGGDLGFVAADGSSSYPDLRVDPAVFEAAAGVRDGDIVPAPVVEAGGFGVVWRRGTIPPVRRTLEQVAPSIRGVLSDDRVRDETNRLVASLRASKVRDFDPSPLDTLPLSSDASAP